MAFGEDDIISLPFRKFTIIVAGLPFSALFICVVCALLLHFERSTATHCLVQNWLPSISAAVSTFAPEKYIWRIFIGVHIGPRLVVSFAFRNFLMYSPLRPLTGVTRFRLLCHLACGLNLLENLFLLALSSISSTEDHAAHKFCFVMFEICASAYMVLSTWLFHYSGRRRATNMGEKSYEFKILTSASSTVLIVLAGYLYWRHNVYCETGMYTLFALSEYCIVLANIFFHCTLYYDFHGKSISLTSSTSSSGGYSFLPTQIEKDT